MSQTDIYRLDDLVAVVPGGSGGIGSRMCLALARVGAAVVVIGRARDRAQAVVDEIESEGGTAIAVAADVTVRDEANRAIATAMDRFGRVDILPTPATTGPMRRSPRGWIGIP
jgi:NADP-dependent 3-hydroxy acid dehydrogenase YdfG